MNGKTAICLSDVLGRGRRDTRAGVGKTRRGSMGAYSSRLHNMRPQGYTQKMGSFRDLVGLPGKRTTSPLRLSPVIARKCS